MANLHCECQELKPKGETNSSFLVLHPSSGVHTVKTVGSHLNNYFCCCRLAFKTWENTVSDITSVTNLDANFHPESFVLLCHTPYGPDTSAFTCTKSENDQFPKRRQCECREKSLLWYF